MRVYFILTSFLSLLCVDSLSVVLLNIIIRICDIIVCSTDLSKILGINRQTENRPPTTAIVVGCLYYVSDFFSVGPSYQKQIDLLGFFKLD